MQATAAARMTETGGLHEVRGELEKDTQAPAAYGGTSNKAYWLMGTGCEQVRESSLRCPLERKLMREGGR